MQSLQISFCDPVSRTLLITVKARAIENGKPHGLFIDNSAAEIVSKIPASSFDFNLPKPTQIGTAIRVHYLDNLARRFINAHKSPVIVNLGCGLDDRAGRIDSDKALFINIDLEDVINIRKKLVREEPSKSISMACSVLDTLWMQEIAAQYGDRDLCFLAEGLLMYFDEETVRIFFKNFADYFNNVTIAFDASNSAVCKMLNKKSFMVKMCATLKWHYDDNKQLELWDSRYKHSSTEYIMALHPLKWGVYNLARLIPKFFKGSTLNIYNISY